MKQLTSARKQQGLSLIELMIALVVGLLLMAAILQMFVGSKVTYSMQNELAKMQENARFAIDFISKDLRMAGYMGCKSYDEVANTLRTATDSDPYSQYDISAPLILENNYSAAAGTSVYLSNTAEPVEGTDLINVKFAELEGSCMVTGHDTSSAVMTCAGHAFESGQILLASDCKKTAILQFTGGNTGKIGHNTGSSVSPGNCSKGLGFPVECSTLGNVSDFTGATVQKFSNYTYYIEENDFGQHALYRTAIGLSSGTARAKAQELVEGVENMQILLGFDTDSDGSADCYSNDAGACNSNMDEVVTVRLSLLMRSLEDNVVSSAQTYVYNGESITATDKRLRKVFTTTITLRNQVL